MFKKEQFRIRASQGHGLRIWLLFPHLLVTNPGFSTQPTLFSKMPRYIAEFKVNFGNPWFQIAHDEWVRLKAENMERTDEG